MIFFEMEMLFGEQAHVTELNHPPQDTQLLKFISDMWTWAREGSWSTTIELAYHNKVSKQDQAEDSCSLVYNNIHIYALIPNRQIKKHHCLLQETKNQIIEILNLIFGSCYNTCI